MMKLPMTMMVVAHSCFSEPPVKWKTSRSVSVMGVCLSFSVSLVDIYKQTVTRCVSGSRSISITRSGHGRSFTKPADLNARVCAIGPETIERWSRPDNFHTSVARETLYIFFEKV